MYYSSVYVTLTPRRVSSFVRNLKARENDESRRVHGPTLHIALKDDDMPKAATGFLKSQGVGDDSSVEFSEVEGYLHV